MIEDILETWKLI